jgi:hypothetical protein
MRFYTMPQQFSCGIDLHAHSMYVCILTKETSLGLGVPRSPNLSGGNAPSCSSFPLLAPCDDGLPAGHGLAVPHCLGDPAHPTEVHQGHTCSCTPPCVTSRSDHRYG